MDAIETIPWSHVQEPREMALAETPVLVSSFRPIAVPPNVVRVPRSLTDKLQMPVANLGLPTEMQLVLEEAGLLWVHQVVSKTVDQLLLVENLGATRVKDLIVTLRRFGLPIKRGVLAECKRLLPKLPPGRRRRSRHKATVQEMALLKARQNHAEHQAHMAGHAALAAARDCAEEPSDDEPPIEFQFE